MFEFLVERAKTREELFEIVIERMEFLERENERLAKELDFALKSWSAAERRAG